MSMPSGCTVGIMDPSRTLTQPIMNWLCARRAHTAEPSRPARLARWMTTGTATPYGWLAWVTAGARCGSNRPASGDARAASEGPVPGFTPRQPRARPG